MKQLKRELIKATAKLAIAGVYLITELCAFIILLQ